MYSTSQEVGSLRATASALAEVKQTLNALVKAAGALAEVKQTLNSLVKEVGELKGLTPVAIKEENNSKYFVIITVVCITVSHFYVCFEIQVNDINLKNIPAKDSYSYGRNVLDTLLTKEEMATSVLLKFKKV